MRQFKEIWNKTPKKKFFEHICQNGDINQEIFFRRQVGIGSKEHCLFGSFSISKMTSSSSTSTNLFRLTPGLQKEKWRILLSDKDFLTDSILSVKCFWKFPASIPEIGFHLPLPKIFFM